MASLAAMDYSDPLSRNSEEFRHEVETVINKQAILQGLGCFASSMLIGSDSVAADGFLFFLLLFDLGRIVEVNVSLTKELENRIAGDVVHAGCRSKPSS